MFPFRPYSEDVLPYYYRGFFKGYIGSERHSPVLDEQPPDDMAQYYNDGVLDGEIYAAEGFPVEPTCRDTSHPPPVVEAIHVVGGVAELAGMAVSYIASHAVALFIEVPLLLLMISIAAGEDYPTLQSTGPPKTLEEFTQFLASFSDLLSLELFVGGGVDPNATGCELQLTRIYRSVDDARAAVLAMGRSAWMIGSMRTDMSGGFRVVERSDS